MNFTQSIGNIVELQCIAKFMELGYECSIPYGNGAKYDFIADANGELLRIQCKAASVPKKKTTGEPDDAIQISTVSQTTNTKKTTRHMYDSNQIDYFATYYQGKVYLIPVEECSTSKTLRFSPPSNNSNNYNKAEDYEIEKRISYSEEILKSKEEFLLNIQAQKNEEWISCSNCGAKITKYSHSGLCPACYSKTVRKAERPNREELKNLIRTKSFLEIGRMYGVTDNAIRKWCIAENLPTKKSDIKTYSDLDWSNI